jgi:hypothetical protein
MNLPPVSDLSCLSLAVALVTGNFHPISSSDTLRWNCLLGRLTLGGDVLSAGDVLLWWPPSSGVPVHAQWVVNGREGVVLEYDNVDGWGMIRQRVSRSVVLLSQGHGSVVHYSVK